MLRSAPHTLDAKGEKILGIFSLTQGDAGNAYQIFVTSDMPWPTVRSDGKDEKLNQPVYEKEREAANREERKKAFDTFFGTWKEFESTLGTLLYSNLKENLVIAKARNYPDSMTAALDANNLPRSVYDALIKSANANLPTLHRYFRLRAKMLGVTDMRYYDLYPPLVKADKKFPLDEGIEMMLAAVKPLGEDYVAAMNKGLDSRWMDVYPRPHKQSGAHMARLGLRRAPLRAAELHRELRFGLGHDARVGPRDALVLLEQGAGLSPTRATRPSSPRSPRR